MRSRETLAEPGGLAGHGILVAYEMLRGDTKIPQLPQLYKADLASTCRLPLIGSANLLQAFHYLVSCGRHSSLCTKYLKPPRLLSSRIQAGQFRYSQQNLHGCFTDVSQT